MEVITTLVSPAEQATFWKEGRTPTEAELKSMALDNAGAEYLAECLRMAQAKSTNKVTDHLPGYSWANWGESAGCVWIDIRNRLNWSPEHLEGPYRLNGYKVLAEKALTAGLTPCSTFGTSHRSWTRLQLRPQESPGQLFSVVEIDREMKLRYTRL
jgi:hypothetical protein